MAFFGVITRDTDHFLINSSNPLRPSLGGICWVGNDVDDFSLFLPPRPQTLSHRLGVVRWRQRWRNEWRSGNYVRYFYSRRGWTGNLFEIGGGEDGQESKSGGVGWRENPPGGKGERVPRSENDPSQKLAAL